MIPFIKLFILRPVYQKKLNKYHMRLEQLFNLVETFYINLKSKEI